jgi:hypothetical protein
MWLVCLSSPRRAQDRRVRLERLERVDHHRQRLVVDVDRGHAVGGV